MNERMPHENEYAKEIAQLTASGTLADVWRINTKMFLEFAKNSFATFEKNKDRFSKNYQLQMEININLENGRLTFTDNAGGISSIEKFLRLYYDERTHLGLKIALFWFGKAYIVTTNPIGETSGTIIHTTFEDVTKKNHAAIRSLPYVQNQYFTKIEINLLNPQNKITKMTDSEAALVAATLQFAYPTAKTIVNFTTANGRLYKFDYQF